MLAEDAVVTATKIGKRIKNVKHTVIKQTRKHRRHVFLLLLNK